MKLTTNAFATALAVSNSLAFAKTIGAHSVKASPFVSRLEGALAVQDGSSARRLTRFSFLGD
jgi:hypothetical protein